MVLAGAGGSAAASEGVGGSEAGLAEALADPVLVMDGPGSEASARRRSTGDRVTEGAAAVLSPSLLLDRPVMGK